MPIKPSYLGITPSLIRDVFLPNRFFDEAVVNASRAQVYSALVSLASSASPSTKDKIHSLLEIKHVDNAQEATNTGNKVANDLKYFVKLGRQNGIHVSPTALWDGLVENAISSSWTLDNWKEFFQSKISA
ncbi:hypothetical protein BGZ99_010407 [Dissophora globulifera]|uniref:Uncharacterized protein n=1 Tax=Dissophora globulifera TaxID=979702 RepID=A0A9P6R6C9_9FUNG|nr:hypothetical protein BGZ99_010407 [Dissophora globulifera]